MEILAFIIMGLSLICCFTSHFMNKNITRWLIYFIISLILFLMMITPEYQVVSSEYFITNKYKNITFSSPVLIVITKSKKHQYSLFTKTDIGIITSSGSVKPKKGSYKGQKILNTI